MHRDRRLKLLDRHIRLTRDGAGLIAAARDRIDTAREVVAQTRRLIEVSRSLRERRRESARRGWAQASVGGP